MEREYDGLNGELALDLVLELMRELGKQKVLKPQVLDNVMRIALDATITHPGHRRRLRSYVQTWSPPKPEPRG